MVHAHFGREKECFASQFWSLDATLAFEVMAAGSRGHAARGSPRRAGPTRLSWPRGHAASPHWSLRAARAALHKARSLLDACALEVCARGVVGAPPAARARELHVLALTWRSQCVRDEVWLGPRVRQKDLDHDQTTRRSGTPCQVACSDVRMRSSTHPVKTVPHKDARIFCPAGGTYSRPNSGQPWKCPHARRSELTSRDAPGATR